MPQGAYPRSRLNNKHLCERHFIVNVLRKSGRGQLVPGKERGQARVENQAKFHEGWLWLSPTRKLKDGTGPISVLVLSGDKGAVQTQSVAMECP